MGSAGTGLAFGPESGRVAHWVEERYPVDGTGFGSGRGTESAEVRALKKRAAKPDRANEILKTSNNIRRLHSTIGYLPPVEFEQPHQQAKEMTPDEEVVDQPALR